MDNILAQAKIGIVDFGSQTTTLLQRALGEQRFRTTILSPNKVQAWLKNGEGKGLILSGSYASVHDEKAPTLVPMALEANIPILGICYGMQTLSHMLGGTVEVSPEDREYAKADVEFQTGDPLFHGLSRTGVVWMSHGDSVTRLPSGFVSIAQSVQSRALTAMSHRGKRIWGLQFHPEVTQTVAGKQILFNFVASICGCEPDWDRGSVAKAIQDELANTTKDGQHVVLGVSGGVDSSAAAALAYPVLGKRLHCASIDTGGLRENDLPDVRRTMQFIGASLTVVSAADEFQRVIVGWGWGRDIPYGHPKTFSERFTKASGNFLDTFVGRSDAEQKRRRFKKTYTACLNREIRRIQDEFRASVLLYQGSLRPDFIESRAEGGAVLIKSHHNVGNIFIVPQIHPFRDLFKYEVRELAAELGLPDFVVNRHPFPGPGLYIRVIGVPTLTRLETLSWADARVMEILDTHNLWKEISQPVIGLGCFPSVGIKGDGRTYTDSVLVRCVQSADFMTASGYQIPAPVRQEINATVTRHPRVVRVLFDETPKPPATTEFE